MKSSLQFPFTAILPVILSVLRVAAAQCRMEEKRDVKVSTYGCIFGNFNNATQFNACTNAIAM